MHFIQRSTTRVSCKEKRSDGHSMPPCHIYRATAEDASHRWLAITFVLEVRTAHRIYPEREEELEGKCADNYYFSLSKRFTTKQNSLPLSKMATKPWFSPVNLAGISVGSTEFWRENIRGGWATIFVLLFLFIWRSLKAYSNRQRGDSIVVKPPIPRNLNSGIG